MISRAKECTRSPICTSKDFPSFSLSFFPGSRKSRLFPGSAERSSSNRCWPTMGYPWRWNLECQASTGYDQLHLSLHLQPVVKFLKMKDDSARFYPQKRLCVALCTVKFSAQKWAKLLGRKCKSGRFATWQPNRNAKYDGSGQLNKLSAKQSCIQFTLCSN